MGWAAGDEPLVTEAKIRVAQARGAIYRLRSMVAGIAHTEKREPMLATIDRAFVEMDEVDRHLHR